MTNKRWSKFALMLRLRCSERLEPSKIFTIALRYISIFFCHACADENSFRGMNKLQNLYLHHAAPRAAAQSRTRKPTIKPTTWSKEEPVVERAFVQNLRGENSQMIRRDLLLGSSAAALVVALLTGAAPAVAQPVTAASPDVEAVTVTGTNIRGAVTVGSHVATAGQAEIQALAPVSVSQILSSFPQLSNAGTAPQGENTYTFYSPNIHNLAGSASNSTLVVVDGMRIPGGGSQWAEADPNIIPVVALQRVEVLADGASSIYGSDAVAGVVNFITRRSFDGLQVDGQVGFADGYHTANAEMLWGTHWDSGSVYVATSYTFGSNLALTDRDFISRGDYTAFGGNNQRSA